MVLKRTDYLTFRTTCALSVVRRLLDSNMRERFASVLITKADIAWSHVKVDAVFTSENQRIDLLDGNGSVDRQTEMAQNRGCDDLHFTECKVLPNTISEETMR